MANTDENGCITETILADGMQQVLIAAFAQMLWAYRMRGPLSDTAVERRPESIL